MARTIGTATIQLIVNGNQAQQTITKLLQKGKELQREPEDAQTVGDTIKETNRQLNSGDIERGVHTFHPQTV